MHDLVRLKVKIEALLAETNHDAQMWGIEHRDATRKCQDTERYRTLREVLRLIESELG